MNKKILLSLVVFLSLTLFLPNITKAGLIQFQGYVRLNAFSTETFCGIGLYATSTQNGTYEIDFSDDIKPFVESIEPNKLELISIDYYGAPQDSSLRQSFLKNICQSGNTSSCQMVCVKFKGLGLNKINWNLFNQTEENIVGQVFDTVKISNSVGKEVLQFLVIYTPFDGRIIVGIVGAIITVVVITLIYFKKIRKKEPKVEEQKQPETEIEKKEEVKNSNFENY